VLPIAMHGEQQHVPRAIGEAFACAVHESDRLFVAESRPGFPGHVPREIAGEHVAQHFSWEFQ
jgi:hypothetical protein